ncbi:MAG TPA: hypothetical protein PKU95_00550 [Candidatus Dojkabacteria bacterium]|nr:hypothetical protein [Candidatus Dojkabacteria bacterium]
MRRRILDIRFDENNQMHFLMDPNQYNSRTDVNDLPDSLQEELLEEIPINNSTENRSFYVQTVAEGGRRMANQTMDPGIHYKFMPVFSEEDIARSFIVVSRPEPQTAVMGSPLAPAPSN